MKPQEWFKKEIADLEDDLEFRLETFILEITEEICKKMEEKHISRAKLAELLGVSPPAVTKILNGNSNFTLKTLLSLSKVLDLDLKIRFKEKETVPLESFTLEAPITGLHLGNPPVHYVFSKVSSTEGSISIPAKRKTAATIATGSFLKKTKMKKFAVN